MKYGMVIDLKRCIGCYGCQVFCKTEHANPPGMKWSRVLFYELGKYPAARRLPLPVLCMHCTAPECVDLCPTGASAKRPDGIVTIDEKKCIGCLNCLLACPYGARSFFPEKVEHFPGQGLTPWEEAGYPGHAPGTVMKCDFCLDSVARGQEPSCVRSCMSRARYFGDLDDPESEVSRLVRSERVFRVSPVSEPAAGQSPKTEPSVYYLLPDTLIGKKATEP